MAADNLNTLMQFKQKYRVKRDCCGDLFIPCNGKRGEVFAWNETTLDAHLVNLGKPNLTAKTIISHCPSATIQTIGDTEAILLCPISDYRQFFKAVRARAKMNLSDEQRKKLAERGSASLAAYRNKTGECVQNLQSGLSDDFGDGEDV